MSLTLLALIALAGLLLMLIAGDVNLVFVVGSLGCVYGTVAFCLTWVMTGHSWWALFGFIVVGLVVALALIAAVDTYGTTFTPVFAVLLVLVGVTIAIVR